MNEHSISLLLYSGSPAFCHGNDRLLHVREPFHYPFGMATLFGDPSASSCSLSRLHPNLVIIHYESTHKAQERLVATAGRLGMLLSCSFAHPHTLSHPTVVQIHCSYVFHFPPTTTMNECGVSLMPYSGSPSPSHSNERPPPTSNPLCYPLGTASIFGDPPIFACSLSLLNPTWVPKNYDATHKARERLTATARHVGMLRPFSFVFSHTNSQPIRVAQMSTAPNQTFLHIPTSSPSMGTGLWINSAFGSLFGPTAHNTPRGKTIVPPTNDFICNCRSRLLLDLFCYELNRKAQERFHAPERHVGRCKCMRASAMLASVHQLEAKNSAPQAYSHKRDVVLQQEQHLTRSQINGILPIPPQKGIKQSVAVITKCESPFVHGMDISIIRIAVTTAHPDTHVCL